MNCSIPLHNSENNQIITSFIKGWTKSTKIIKTNIDKDMGIKSEPNFLNQKRTSKIQSSTGITNYCSCNSSNKKKQVKFFLKNQKLKKYTLVVLWLSALQVSPWIVWRISVNLLPSPIHYSKTRETQQSQKNHPRFCESNKKNN